MDYIMDYERNGLWTLWNMDYMDYGLYGLYNLIITIQFTIGID